MPESRINDGRTTTQARMDWFERITGFKEAGYETTRSRLAVENDTLISRFNGSRHCIGRLELPSLRELRERALVGTAPRARTTLTTTVADARVLHREPEHQGACFQVASQFNLLEMTGPNVTPEDGVTRYRFDPTQGPACAIAAGAATIFRNYLAPIGGDRGQTVNRQIDTLAPLGEALASALKRPVRSLWTMQNGYALCTPDGLAAINALLCRCDEEARDVLRAHLRIGLHEDVEVTDLEHHERHCVTQAFCSALPVAYTTIPPALWEPFAALVLEAAYEATLLSAALQHAQGGSNRVFLTRLGGGAYGNRDRWIDASLERALHKIEHCGLDVVVVAFSGVRPGLQALVDRWRA